MPPNSVMKQNTKPQIVYLRFHISLFNSVRFRGNFADDWQQNRHSRTAPVFICRTFGDDFSVNLFDQIFYQIQPQTDSGGFVDIGAFIFIGE